MTGPMIDVLFEVPIEPQAKERPRAAMVPVGKGKKVARIYTPKASLEWGAKLALLASAKMPRTRIDEAIRVDVLFVLSRPKKLNRKKDPDGLMWAPVKPDRDNLDKNVLDGFKTFWRDDGIVVDGRVLKAYAEKQGRPRVVVRIRSAESIDAAINQIFGGDQE